MIRNLIIEVFEPIRKYSFVRNQQFLRKTRRYSIEQLEELQLKKLKNILKHHALNNSWFADRVKGLELNNLDDLLKIPILEKKDLSDNFENLLKSATNQKRFYQIVRSGGTTGQPVQLLIGNESRMMAVAEFYQFYEDWGIKKGDSVFVLWGQHDAFIKSRQNRVLKYIKEWFKNKKITNTFYIDDNRLDEIYQEAFRFNSKVLRGYTNSLMVFCDYLKKNDLQIWPNLKMISCTAEKLTEESRNKLETIFKVPVSNQYGCGELNSIAADCPLKALHVEQEHVILETVDDNGIPVFEKPGHILLTDLDNYVTPLIRYKVGDIGILSLVKCSCGRSHIVLKEITGRLSEIIALSNGRTIDYVYFSVLLRDVVEISTACVRVVTSSLLQIDLQLKKEIPIDHLRYIQNSLREHVGPEIQFEFRSVEKIPPLKNGKSPWVRYIGQEEYDVKVLELIKDFTKE